MRSTQAIDRLNKNMTNDRADYMKKIDQMVNISKMRRWCENHPASNWVVGYARCKQGVLQDEECIEGKND